MVARARHRAGDAGAQMRLAAARLGAGQPFEIEAEALLELIGKAQLLGVVAAEGDDQRALVAVADRDPGGGLELAGKIRPQTLGFPGSAPSSGSSPGSVSTAAASMPAAAQLAPWPASPRS